MQLVELQRNVEAVRGDEVAIIACSYDPVGVLAEFAAKHDITYRLLSDVGSVVMEELGLLHQAMEAEREYWGRAMDARHHRLPYPGTFVLDGDGVVVDKVFERSPRIRPGGKLLLARMGLEGGANESLVTAEGPGLTAAVWVDTPQYFPNQLNRLTVRLGPADGYHLYVPPNPPGFTDLAIAIDAPEGVLVYPAELPSGHPFRIEGLDEDFTVVEGEHQLDIEFYVLEDTGDFDLPIRISYQACSATTCLAPDALDVAIPLREVRA